LSNKVKGRVKSSGGYTPFLLKKNSKKLAKLKFQHKLKTLKKTITGRRQ